MQYNNLPAGIKKKRLFVNTGDEAMQESKQQINTKHTITDQKPDYELLHRKCAYHLIAFAHLTS